MNAFCVTRCMKYKSLKYNQTLNSGGGVLQKKKKIVIERFDFNYAFRC